MCRAMSARRSHPSTVFTSHQITYTVKARGRTVTKPLIVSVKIFRMGQSSHVQDRGAAAALHVIFRPIVVHVVPNKGSRRRFNRARAGGGPRADTGAHQGVGRLREPFPP